MKNKYYNYSRILELKFRKVVQYFSLDIDVIKAAEVTHLNRIQQARFLMELANYLLKSMQITPFDGTVELVKELEEIDVVEQTVKT